MDKIEERGHERKNLCFIQLALVIVQNSNYVKKTFVLALKECFVKLFVQCFIEDLFVI